MIKAACSVSITFAVAVAACGSRSPVAGTPPDAGQTRPMNGTGEPCTTESDCPSGLCLPIGSGSVCTTTCATGSDCVAGWTCVAVSGQSSRICACTSNAEVCDGEDDDCDGIVDNEPTVDQACAAEAAADFACVDGTCIDVGDAGFDTPTVSVHANTQNADGSWTDDGPADLSCLDTPSSDTPTGHAIALSTMVRDFQTQNAIGGASVTVFDAIAYTMPFGTETADPGGNVTVTLPTGTGRFGFEMTAALQLPTLLLNQKVDPDGGSAQTLAEIQSVSANTTAIFPALIGVERDSGTGVALGTLRDCQNRPMSGFVVTVSSTPSVATPLVGAQAYYFSPMTNPLPVRHSTSAYATGNGMFMVIQVPVAATVYIQAWGFPTDADIGRAAGMTLLSQLAAPSLADTVTSGSFEPLQQP